MELAHLAVGAAHRDRFAHLEVGAARAPDPAAPPRPHPPRPPYPRNALSDRVAPLIFTNSCSRSCTVSFAFVSAEAS